MELVKQFFPNCSPQQLEQLQTLTQVFIETNQRVNLISRKDEQGIEEHHILHSLAIARFIQFAPGTRVFDLGTGGGFPGLVLAIWFPDAEFVLCDSIGKKISAVQSMAEHLELKNVSCFNGRAESYQGQVDFVVSRAVARTAKLWEWARPCIKKQGINAIHNGFILLKGGDLQDEIAEWKNATGRKKYEAHPISWYFDRPFFESKKVIYLPI